MRILFSLAGLLIVLAVVMWLAKTQLKAVTPLVSTTPAAPPGAAAPAGGTVPEQSRQMQQQVKQGIERALEQGAARASDSQP